MGSAMNLLRILLAILVPPLGVFLTFGLGPTFIINLLLTLLGWLPGSIHAVWAIMKHEQQLNRQL
ncbi:YqaE/Pmp3 family membrane protein [Leptolyngbya sp. 7M]|nr:YqaE/Pmp3 family membrane protein [Leptolyngbya sp. 7M]